MIQTLLSISLLVSIISAETCKISNLNSKGVRIVSARLKKDMSLLCSALIIEDNLVLLPIACLSYLDKAEYFPPSNVVFVSGNVGNDSCIQTRQGIEVKFPSGEEEQSALHRMHMVFVEVEPFEFEPNTQLLPIFPDDKMRDASWDGIRHNRTSCEVPIFLNNKNFNNVSWVNVTYAHPTRCEEFYCTDSSFCYEKLKLTWDFECFLLPDGMDECTLFTEGSPLFCGGEMWGVLRICKGNSPVMVQKFLKNIIAVSCAPIETILANLTLLVLITMGLTWAFS